MTMPMLGQQVVSTFIYSPVISACQNIPLKLNLSLTLEKFISWFISQAQNQGKMVWV